MEQGLKDLHLHAGTVCFTDHSDNPTVAGADTPVSITTGAPMQIVNAHLLGVHVSNWLLLAVNSEGVPAGLVEQLRGTIYNVNLLRETPLVTGFLAPSTWNKEVLERTFPGKPVLLCQHGVFDRFKPVPELHQELEALYARGTFRVLHITSTLKDRKSTEALLKAWKVFVESKTVADPSLLLWVNSVYIADLQKMLQTQGIPKVRIFTGVGMPESMLIDVYNRVHVVCQPSRAEGFGLTPLEARVCGTPVVATACTGHADHVHGPGTFIVEHGPHAAVDDFWDAQAPTVTEHAIVDGLQRAAAGWQKAHAEMLGAADNIREQWLWKNKIQDAIQQLTK
jgi:glycosyltransferase involved in cell wall biosynthesis